MKQNHTYLKLYISLLLLFIIGINYSVKAQNPVIEDIIEDLVNNTGAEEQDYTTFIENLNNFLQNPINLNNTDVEQLEQLIFLSDFQIENLLNHVGSSGGMLTIYELQLIEGFDKNTIQKLLPFVKVEEVKKQEKLELNKIFKYGRHKIIAQTKFITQTQKGYISVHDTILAESPNSVYQGDRMKYLMRYKFHYKQKIFAGITMEKDPGEKFAFGNNYYGFDYYSAHFQINNIGKLKTLTVGDFQAKFGQGLVMWSGFGMGKSSDVLNIRKKAQGIRRYSSTNENQFYRGAGATFEFNDFEITAFASRKKIDANLENNDTTDTDFAEITSIQNTGNHRTISEIEDKNIIGQSIIGGNITYRQDIFKIGLNAIYDKLDATINKSDKPYNYFALSDDNNFNISLDYTVFYKKISLFGEAAIDKNFGTAFLNGLVLDLVPQISFSLMHRYYQKEYNAHYANAMVEGSKINNESGFFYGLVFLPIAKLKISAYADMFEFPWLNFGVNSPAQGVEYLIQSDYYINRYVQMYFRWKSETKMNNLPSGSDIIIDVNERKKNYFRYHISYSASRILKFRSRVEFSNYNFNNEKETGFLAFQDVNLNFATIPIGLYFRYAMFETTYNTRFYEYENDILYSFSVPAYSGRGTRLYLMLKYEVSDDIDLRLRYSHFHYRDNNTIGSGLDEIEGRLKSEIKIQFTVKL